MLRWLTVVVVFVLAGLLILALSVFVTDWRDTAPTWISGVGGIMGALAAVIALLVAFRADDEHVNWVTSVTKVSAKGSPLAYNIVNSSRRTVALVTVVNDVTVEKRPEVPSAVDIKVHGSYEVMPGGGFPLGLSRSMANIAPTVLEITWRERRFAAKRFTKREHTGRLYL